MMEAVCTFETLVYINKTTWCYTPEDCHFRVEETTEYEIWGSHDSEDVIVGL
jgi:hypothetical protein